MSGDNDSENKALSDAIVAAVEKHWKDTDRAMLLSSVGTDLVDTHVWNPDKFGITLRTYVETFLKDRLIIERRPGYPSIIGLFPNTAILSENLSEYFNPPPRKGPAAFKPAIWLAFRNPIPDNHVRLVNLQDNQSQDRAAPVTQLAAEEFLVTASDQPLPQFLGDAKATRQAIERWAAAKRIDIANLQVNSNVSGAAGEATSAPVRRNLLEALLAALDPKDQQRISMPLDVVDRLRRHTP